MTDRQLEQRLSEALARTAPNDPTDVLSRCKQRKGTVISLKQHKSHRWIKGLIAACLVLILSGGGLFYHQTNAVASIVSLDVNPSVKLEVNRAERILNCRPLNEKAEQLLAELNSGADLKGTKLDVAVHALVGLLVRNGYLDSLSSAILISVEDPDPDRAARLRSQLTSTVDTVLQEKSSDAAILSQTLEKNTHWEQQAKAHGISTGKAALIGQILLQNSTLDFDRLARLSVEELRDLLETGSSAMPIGSEEALRLVLSDAGLSQQQVLHWEIDPELDEAKPHYEVELHTAAGEWEYRIDAYTGTILSRSTPASPQTPAFSATPTPTPSPVPTPAPSGTPSVLDAPGALNLALADFTAKYPALAADGAERTSVETDWEEGRLRYEVEFRLGGYRVEYEIDAVTGTVLEWETDYKGAANVTPQTDIGAEKAKALALAHAGLTAEETSRLQVERDGDDGRPEYEVEFQVGRYEYEYVIDGATGAVLEHRKEQDD